MKYVQGNIWVNNHAHVLKGNPNFVSTQFLSYVLKSYDFSSLLVGGSRYKLNAETLMSINLFIPGGKEQNKISEFLDVLDNTSEILQKKLLALKKYKEGFINEWFSSGREPTKYLYELVTQKTSQLLTSHFKENSGTYPVYDAGGKQYTHISFYNNDTDSIAIIKYGSSCGRTFITRGLHSVLGTMSELVPYDQSMLMYVYAFTLSNEFKKVCHKFTEIGTTPNLYFSDYSYSKIFVTSKKDVDKFTIIFNLFEQLEMIYQNKENILASIKSFLLDNLFV